MTPDRLLTENEAALRVIRTSDGLHRLSFAVAAWSTAVANEGDRPHSPPLAAQLEVG